MQAIHGAHHAGRRVGSEVYDIFQAFASRRDVTLAACDHGYENLPWDKFKTRTYLLKVGF